MSRPTGGRWKPSEQQRDAIISDIVLDAPYALDTGHNHTEYYGGYCICESVLPQNRNIIAASPVMLLALEAVRAYLWGRLCADNLGGGEAHNPLSILYRQVEAAIESATLGAEGRPA